MKNYRIVTDKDNDAFQTFVIVLRAQVAREAARAREAQAREVQQMKGQK